MISLIQQCNPVHSTVTETGMLATTLLFGHDKASKKVALQAVEVLKEYKLNVMSLLMKFLIIGHFRKE